MKMIYNLAIIGGVIIAILGVYGLIRSAPPPNDPIPSVWQIKHDAWMKNWREYTAARTPLWEEYSSLGKQWWDYYNSGNQVQLAKITERMSTLQKHMHEVYETYCINQQASE